MNHYEKTKEYYAKWLDIDVDVFNKKGIFLNQTKERDIKQIGYPKRYTIYAIEIKDLIVISYSESVSASIIELREQLNKMTVPIQSIFENLFTSKLNQSHLFYFHEQVDIDTSNVIQLKKSNYDAYLKFFITQYQESDPSDWLEEYFLSLVEKGICFGIKCNDDLVSVTDAPDIPYMNDIIVEPGINTLTNYRHHGYAKQVVTACCNEIIRQEKVPIWSCDFSNVASRALALSVGFKQFGKLYTVSE